MLHYISHISPSAFRTTCIYIYIYIFIYHTILLVRYHIILYNRLYPHLPFRWRIAVPSAGAVLYQSLSTSQLSPEIPGHVDSGNRGKGRTGKEENAYIKLFNLFSTPPPPPCFWLSRKELTEMCQDVSVDWLKIWGKYDDAEKKWFSETSGVRARPLTLALSAVWVCVFLGTLRTRCVA